jgi:hypothetical protein
MDIDIYNFKLNKRLLNLNEKRLRKIYLRLEREVRMEKVNVRVGLKLRLFNRSRLA